jgi:hypothetical protein
MRRWVMVLVAAVWLALGAPGAAASGWSIQPTPTRGRRSQRPEQRILFLSSGVPRCRVLRADGQQLALLAGGTVERAHVADSPHLVGHLDQCSCPARSECVAVGAQPTSPGTTPLAQRLYDSMWQVQPVAVPAGATQSYFEGVSCATPNACTAVESSFTSSNTYSILAEYWDGSNLIPVVAPGAIACRRGGRCRPPRPGRALRAARWR